MKKWIRKVDLLKFSVALLDLLCFQVSLVAGYLLWVRLPWHGNWQYFNEYSVVMWLLPPIAIIVFKSVDLYKPSMGVIGVQEQSHIFKAIWIIYFMTFAITFFFRDIHVSRLATLYSMMISLVLISTERYFVRGLFSYLNTKNLANRKAIIYGAGYHGVRLARWILQTPHLGIHVLGYLDDNVEALNKMPDDLPLLGSREDIEALVKKEDITILFIAHRSLEEEKIISIIQLCRELKVRCWVIPSLYRFHVERVEIQHIGGIPLLGFKHDFSSRTYEYFKQGLDFLIAIVIIVLLSPLMIFVAGSVYFTAGKPIFFKQKRVGKDHKKFVMYKFRTMKPRMKGDDVSPELQKDPKKYLTPLGGFLRRTGLDEIPQIFNVLKGEMSLVGPRPEMPFLVKRYGPLEKERLTVKPGITGLWQISEDRKRLLIHENMDYDIYYVENMGFNLDLAILLKTCFAVLKRLIKKTSS